MKTQTPLLLLPGLMNDERIWDCFQSTVGRTVITANTHAADNIAAIASTAIARMPAGRFAVAGFSLGGYVALEVCRQVQDRIAGVALLDTSARADTTESRVNRQRMIDALDTGSANFAQVAASFAERLLHRSHVDDPVLLQLLGDMARAVGARGFVLQQTAAMRRSDARDILVELRCPALVLCGRHDQVTPPVLSEEMARLLPGDVELVLVPEAGHMTTLEQPTIVAGALRRWIERVDASEA